MRSEPISTDKHVGLSNLVNACKLQTQLLFNVTLLETAATVNNYSVIV